MASWSVFVHRSRYSYRSLTLHADMWQEQLDTKFDRIDAFDLTGLDVPSYLQDQVDDGELDLQVDTGFWPNIYVAESGGGLCDVVTDLRSQLRMLSRPTHATKQTPARAQYWLVLEVWDND